MEYYSTIRKKEILLFAATRIGLEGIMLSETSQRKTNIACYHLNMCYFKKQVKVIETECRKVIAREDGGNRERLVKGYKYYSKNE